MANKSIFSKLSRWFQTTEVFAGPSKKIQGKWHLFEYYIDGKEELLHFTENTLNEKQLAAEIRFNAKGAFLFKTNLPVNLIRNIQEGGWSISNNFITFIDPVNFRNNIEFQFAFEKGDLKLLKKNSLGEIEFFGFFRKQKPAS